MVRPVMAERQLVGSPAHRQGEHLVAQTNAEDRYLPQEVSSRVDRIAERLGIARPVREENAVRLQRQDFDSAAEVAALTSGRTDIGAVVTFTGICRGSEAGEAIAALTLEHYPGMAEAEIARHVAEAESRWPLLGVTVIHRYGRLAAGENIVLVVTVSSHRQAAFAAAEFLMDYLKTRAPFWKQVESAGATAWVEAKEADDASAERWLQPAARRDAAE